MEFGDNNGRDKRGLQFWRDVSGASDKKGADAISPVSHSDRADAPILLIRGDREPLDPVWESRNMERALNKAGKPVETVVIKGQDYWAWQEATRMQTLAAAVAFVEKNNPAR
jgi:dipeptidyl aminopeptidase/acylaminoacyl peptidase